MSRETSPRIRTQNRFVAFWAKTFPYIKLQTKLSFTAQRRQSVGRRVAKYIVDFLVFVAIMVFLFLLLRALVTQSTKIPGKSISIALFTLSQLILLVMSVAQQCKRLHRPEDIRIITSFPLTPFQRYLGEIISIYVRLLFFSLLFFWPVMIVYGAAMAVADSTIKVGTIVAFIFSSLFATILLPLVPFAVSLVISVPFMYLVSFLSNKNIAKLVIFILGFVILLVIYSLVLRFMADWYIHAKNNVEVMEGIASFLNRMNKPYNPSYFTSEIAVMENVGINFLCVLAIGIVFGAAGIAITKPLYHRFATSASSLEQLTAVRKTKLNSDNAFKTIFTKEVKQIVRTEAYAYFYLGVAFAIPIMTYLVADIVQMLGKSHTGNTIFFGFAFMILFIILSLIGSFSANAISREGTQFYITKVSPISYRKQLLAKALVNFTVAFGTMFLCVIVLAATANTSQDAKMGLSAVDVVFLFFMALFFLIGVTFNGINLNLARPKIDVNNAAPNESNVVIQLLIAIFVTGIASIFVIVVDGVLGVSSSICHAIILALMVVYAGINFLIFFFTAERKYAKIEAK